VGVSDGIVAKCVFEERNGCVIEDEVSELMRGERDVG
jgi:hypothetical protein